MASTTPAPTPTPASASKITVSFEGVSLDQIAPWLQSLMEAGLQTSLVISDASDDELAPILDQLQGPATPAEPAEAVLAHPDRWRAEDLRAWISELTPQAFVVAQMLAEGNGTVKIDEVYERLGITSGKALGGVRSSFGFSARKVREELTSPVTRDAHTSTFKVDHSVLRSFRAAVAMRVRTDGSTAAA